MLWTHAAAAALALALGFGAGWRVQGWRATATAAEHEQQAAQDAARRFEHATAAAATYEVAREAQRVRTVTITREVQREVQADPDCSVRPMPDGLRSALEHASAAGADQPVAVGPVPAAPAASAGDLGGSGPGLRRPPG
jgi:hypothetical protein